METIWDEKIYNYVIVYIDTIIAATNDLETAIKHKQELLNGDLYVKKDKIIIYARINY